jgi:peptide/nickel transport system substrate-binding protein
LNNKGWLVTLAILLAVLLAACGGDENSGDGNEGNGSEATGGDLILNTLSDAVSMDVHITNDVPSANIQDQIYEKLVMQDEDTEIQPALAESWEPLDDLTWEFNLRQGVTFHDGTDFNAEAVKINLDRIRSEEIGSPRAVQFEMITEVEVIDEYTIHLHLEYPFAPILANLSNIGGAIMSPATIEADNEAVANGSSVGSYINENPAGTGFLKFESWSPGNELKMVRNDDYWDGAVAYDSITFEIIPEGATRVANLETGHAHIIDPLAPNEAERVKNMDGASVVMQDSVGLAYIGFNMEKEPFDNILVRQAISMAINKAEIIEGVYDGYGLVAEGALAPPVVGATTDIPSLEYDVEGAKAKLAEAGFEDGFSTTIWTNDNPLRVDIATAAQSALGEIGIEVEIEVLEWGAYLDRTGEGEHDMFILGWSNQNANADNGLYPIFHSSQKGSSGNRSMLDDPEVDRLLEEARQTTDEDEQLQLYHEAQERLVELAPMIYLLHQTYLSGHLDTVEGFSVNPIGIYQLKDVTFNE